MEASPSAYMKKRITVCRVCKKRWVSLVPKGEAHPKQCSIRCRKKFQAILEERGRRVKPKKYLMGECMRCRRNLMVRLKAGIPLAFCDDCREQRDRLKRAAMNRVRYWRDRLNAVEDPEKLKRIGKRLEEESKKYEEI